jgi:CRISPR-associated protein Csx17
MFLEPVEPDGRFFNWPKNKNRSAVWSNRSLAANLAAIFRRRQMEVFRDAKDGSSARSHRPARLADVIAFLHSETDDHRIADLCWALTAIAWPELGDGEAPESSGEPYVLPFEFGVPRLLVEPRAIDAVGGRWKLTPGEEPNIKPDPRVFDILASGQSDAVERCVDSAARRLKSGGQIIHGYRNRRQAGRPLAFRSPVAAERLLAAMLFPLSNHSMETVANAVLYKPETPD